MNIHLWRSQFSVDGWNRKFRLVAAVVVAFLAVLMGAASKADDVPQWTVSRDGQSLKDAATQLEWLRCVEGQVWTKKTCTGEPTMLGWAQAAALIRKRSQDSTRNCRLPTLGELQRLINSGAFAKSQNPTLFPSISSDVRWTGTRIFNVEKGTPYNYANVVTGRKNDPSVQLDIAHAWTVNLATGEAHKDVHRRTQLPVQFVCTTTN
jgi:hypothetical protein